MKNPLFAPGSMPVSLHTKLKSVRPRFFDQFKTHVSHPLLTIPVVKSIERKSELAPQSPYIKSMRKKEKDQAIIQDGHFTSSFAFRVEIRKKPINNLIKVDKEVQIGGNYKESPLTTRKIVNCPMSPMECYETSRSERVSSMKILNTYDKCARHSWRPTKRKLLANKTSSALNIEKPAVKKRPEKVVLYKRRTIASKRMPLQQGRLVKGPACKPTNNQFLSSNK